MKNPRSLASITLLSAALLAGAGRCADAAGGPGTSGAQFLKIGPSARLAALADSGAALAGDAYAAHYNPAGLALVKKPSMAASHASYVLGAGYRYGAAALPLAAGGALAFSVANLGLEGLERRVEDTDLPAGYFDSSNFAYSLAYGGAVTERLSAGLAVKRVSVIIDEVSGGATALDAGLRYETDALEGLPFYAALSLRNFGGKLKLGQGEDPLPAAVALGGFVRPHPRLAVTLDLIRYRDSGLLAAAGGEYELPLTDRLGGRLRAGYSTQRRDLDGNSGFTLGAGLAFPALAFDFAWVPFGEMGDTFRYSFLVNF